MTRTLPVEPAAAKAIPPVAVIGCGYWGKNLVRNFKELGSLALVADVTEGGRQTAAGLAPGVPVVERLESALASGVAGVVISTPAETHFELVRDALAAGKDVFVEKPLALHPGEGAELLRLAEAKGRVLMVGHVLEYHPAIVRLHELVRAGELGKVQYIYSNRLSLGKVR
ncbi:MAG: Gfo/Idh/MocA family protein, partial [Nitrososphaerales archaeon]